jgi:hypothetical protein
MDEPNCHTSNVDIDSPIRDVARIERLEASTRKSTTETWKHEPTAPNLKTPLFEATLPAICIMLRSDMQLPKFKQFIKLMLPESLL